LNRALSKFARELFRGQVEFQAFAYGAFKMFKVQRRGCDQFSKVTDGAGVSKVGFCADVSGVIRNSTITMRNHDPLRLALVDRLEQPLLIFRLGDPMTLERGEALFFQHRVYFNDPIRSKVSRDAPPWQVRVGTVAHQLGHCRVGQTLVRVDQ
jgi:hypothetical protein